MYTLSTAGLCVDLCTNDERGCSGKWGRGTCVCVCASVCAHQLRVSLHLPQISQEETQTFPLSSVVTLSAYNIRTSDAEGTSTLQVVSFPAPVTHE